MSADNVKLPQRVRILERKLGRENALGLAYQGIGIIEIDPRQCERERLDTLIHELMHLLEPDWSEERVEVSANWMAAVLWKQGYRRVRDR